MRITVTPLPNGRYILTDKDRPGVGLGSFPSRVRAMQAGSTLYARELSQNLTAAGELPPPDGGTPFWAIVAFQDVESDDGRLFRNLQIREMPLALWWQGSNLPGHDGAMIVGRFDTMTIAGDDMTVEGTGFYDGSEDAQTAMKQAAEKTNYGISMDATSNDYPVWECMEYDDAGWCSGRERTVYDGAIIVSATQVATPAFAGAQISLTGMPTFTPTAAEDAPAPPEGADMDWMSWFFFNTEKVGAATGQPRTSVVHLTAAATEFADLPLGDRKATWSASTADTNLRKKASSDGSGDKGTIDWKEYAKGFFWVDPDNTESFGGYKLPFADVVDGVVTAQWGGITGSASAIQGSRGGINIPDEDVAGVKDHIASYYDKAAKQYGDESIKAPWASLIVEEPCGCNDEGGADTAALVAAAVAAPAAPPAAWFEDPQLSGPTPLTIFDDGRIAGHIATWDTCHSGFQNQCTLAPRSPSNYRYFHLGVVRTAEGTDVPVGTLTMDTGHAPSGSAAAALAHYDNTGSGVADLHVGEDIYGIWAAGVLRPGVTEDQIRTLRANGVSGDWRRERDARGADLGLELRAVLAVPVPGFPVPRAELAASGAVETLVAAGTPLLLAEIREPWRRELAEQRAEIGTLRAALAPLLPLARARLRSMR
jgi:hypothetical protein